MIDVTEDRCHQDSQLNPDRGLKKNPIALGEQAMLRRATSNQGGYYCGEGRFFILVGKAFAETMRELQGK